MSSFPFIMTISCFQTLNTKQEISLRMMSSIQRGKQYPHQVTRDSSQEISFRKWIWWTWMLKKVWPDLKSSLLEMKGKLTSHLGSPNHHHNFVLFSNWRLPFRNAQKNQTSQLENGWLSGDSLIVPQSHTWIGAQRLEGAPSTFLSE